MCRPNVLVIAENDRLIFATADRLHLSLADLPRSLANVASSPHFMFKSFSPNSCLDKTTSEDNEVAFADLNLTNGIQTNVRLLSIEWTSNAPFEWPDRTYAFDVLATAFDPSSSVPASEGLNELYPTNMLTKAETRCREIFWIVRSEDDLSTSCLHRPFTTWTQLLNLLRPPCEWLLPASRLPRLSFLLVYNPACAFLVALHTRLSRSHASENWPSLYLEIQPLHSLPPPHTDMPCLFT